MQGGDKVLIPVLKLIGGTATLGTVVRKEVCSLFQIYILCTSKKYAERDIFIFAKAIVRVMCFLNEISLLRNFLRSY